MKFQILNRKKFFYEKKSLSSQLDSNSKFTTKLVKSQSNLNFSQNFEIFTFQIQSQNYLIF